MTYASTCLTREEWVRALDKSQIEFSALGERLMLAGETKPVDETQINAILDHLACLAADDSGYAWWSAHSYAKLGEDWVENPYAELPARLAERMKQRKETP